MLAAFSSSDTKVRAILFRGETEELVRALQLGHPGAPAVLFERYSQSLLSMLRHLVGSHADALDLLQESLLAALREVRSLRDPRSLESWLKGVAARTAFAFLRKRRRRSRLAALGLGAPPPALQPPIEAVAALRALHRVLSELPVQEQVAFSLRYLDGLTVHEAAEIAGQSLSTFKRRLAGAEGHVNERAREEAELRPWMEGGGPCPIKKRA